MLEELIATWAWARLRQCKHNTKQTTSMCSVLDNFTLAKMKHIFLCYYVKATLLIISEVLIYFIDLMKWRIIKDTKKNFLWALSELHLQESKITAYLAIIRPLKFFVSYFNSIMSHNAAQTWLKSPNFFSIIKKEKINFWQVLIQFPLLSQ